MKAPKAPKPTKAPKAPKPTKLSRKFSRLIKQAEKADWDEVAKTLESLLEKHKDELTYIQLVAGAKWMLDSGHWILCYKLGYEALLREPERPEAPEVLFFLFLHRNETERAEDCLTLVRNYGGDKPQYLIWEILLMNDQGNNLGVLKMYDEGRIPFEREDPRLSEIVFSVMMALITANRVPEAREMVDKYYPEVTDENPNIINLHAKVNQAEENFAEAVKYFEMNETIRKGEQVGIEACWNKALLQLQYGDLENGWENYEARWDWERFPTRKFDFSSPKWAGESLAGRSILLWGEQGIGDEVLFLTLLPNLLELGPSRVGIYASKKLCPVIERWYPSASVYPFGEGAEVSEDIDFDYHLPVGSLPIRLGNPDISGPKHFIKERPETIALRERLLAQHPGKTRIVGLSWRSGVLTHRRIQYYLSHHAVADILAEAPDDVLFVSLQYSLLEEEKEALGLEPNMYIPDEDFFDDLASQLNYIQTCDLVVTSGSICLALSGITAQPCITWGPKRVWTLLGGDKYPWFPLVHMIKCEPAWDLGALVNSINKLLKIFYSR